MAKKSQDARADQPIVPQVSLETWKELCLAAEDFNRLAPWKWMHDSQVIALRHPVTSEVLLGSILGRLRTLFALALYRNAAGHRWILNAILNDGVSVMDDDIAFGQDAIKTEFVLKRELEKEDRAVLDTAQFSPSLKSGRAWPQFRSMVPGGYPWHVTQHEAETMLFALPRVAAIARLARETPDLWDAHLHGEIAFLPDHFDPVRNELRAEQIDWQPMVPPPEPLAELVSLDNATINGLLSLNRAQGFHLELDLTYSAMIVVADAERPRLPKLAMAVDRESGFVGGFHLGDVTDRDGATALGIVLRKTLTQLGARPEFILVQRPRVAAMLAKVASQLGIPVVFDAELDQLNSARASIEAHFRRR